MLLVENSKLGISFFAKAAKAVGVKMSKKNAFLDPVETTRNPASTKQTFSSSTLYRRKFLWASKSRMGILQRLKVEYENMKKLLSDRSESFRVD